MQLILVYCSLLFLVLNAHSQQQLSFKSTEEMLTWVKNIIPQNPVILEAGGHYGEDTQAMKKIWPTAHIHVFEALPSSFEVLIRNTKSASDVHVYACALSNYTGYTNFYLNPQNDGSSSIGAPVDFNKKEFDLKPIQVPCITLDDWAIQHKISHIDFMWLDLEGHELAVLQHASHFLSSVNAIYTEINFIHTRETACLYVDLKKFLESKDFVEVWQESYGRFGNALFIKKRKRQSTNRNG